jgi:hypothetical protein
MARTEKPYKLVPAEVPARSGRSGGVYAAIVAEFARGGLAAALVEMPGKKPETMALGLRKAAAAEGAVRVVTRGGRVYLEKA